MLAYFRKISGQADGASAVEYGPLVASIAAVIILVVFADRHTRQGRVQGHLHGV